MFRSRLWLLLVAPALAVAVILTQQLVFADPAVAASLRGFGSCGELLSYYQERARDARDDYYYWEDEEVEIQEAEEAATEEAAEPAFDSDSADSGFAADQGASSSSQAREEPAMVQESEEAAAEAPVGAEPADGGEVSESGTNVQERGVDESDIIKTDGRYLYVLRANVLIIAEIVDGGGPVEVGRFAFDGYGQQQELLIGSDPLKAIVVRQLDDRISTWAPELPEHVLRPSQPIEIYRPQSAILEIDISDPTDPQLLRELDLDGRYITARMVGEDVRVVFEHRPWGGTVEPWHFGGWDRRSVEAAAAYNEAALEQTPLSRWQPLYGFSDHVRFEFGQGYALDCDRTYAPDLDESPVWRQAVSYLLSFELAEGLGARGNVGVLSDHPTVYSAQESLYLSTPTRNWSNALIHRFDVADPLAPDYAGSGWVRGQLLSQWAMSEHQGHLRVATTIFDRWPTLSNVFVLKINDGADGPVGLEQVGLESGLGVTESIFAVRFAGDVGYVVTFRQTDPLYVLDLSDPTNPMTVGELKIPGFSRYLHPLSGGLLLGIGRDADERTGRELGLQASLFDVSDPTNPQRISLLDLGEDTRSAVEWDHRAFRYQNGVAWIPVAPTDWRYYDDHDGAYLGVRVDSSGLTHESTLRVQGEAKRAMPIGGQIHLLSDDEIRTYSLETYESQGRLNFADEWDNRWLPPQPAETTEVVEQAEPQEAEAAEAAKEE